MADVTNSPAFLASPPDQPMTGVEVPTQPPAGAAPDVTPAAPPAAPSIPGVGGAPAVAPPPPGGAPDPDAATAAATAATAATSPQVAARKGFRAGFAAATMPPSYTMDANGNMINTNPTATGFKALAGSVVGGMLKGASEGIAAERGESGAAAAQRLGQAADDKARAAAAATFERQRQVQKDLLEHNETVARTTRLVLQSKIDAEQLAENHKVWARGDASWAQTQDAYIQGQQKMMGQYIAQLTAHSVPKVSEFTPRVKQAGDVDVTPQGPVRPGDDASTILGQMKPNSQNYANGKLTPIQIGGSKENNGVANFQTSDLQKPITQPFYYQVFKGVLDGQGNPIMEDRVIQPKDANGNPTGITYYNVLGEIMGAAEQADVQMKQLGTAHQNRMNALQEESEKAKTGEAKAGTVQKYAEANKANADAEAARANLPGGAGSNNIVGPSLVESIKALPKPAQDMLSTYGANDQAKLMSVLDGEEDLKIFPTRPGPKGSAKVITQQDAAGLLEQLASASGRGHFDPTRAEAYKKTRLDFSGGGKNASDIQALNTALGHLLSYSQSATTHGSIPGVRGLSGLVGNDAANQQSTDLQALASEIAKAYKSGEPTKDEIEGWKSRLDGYTKSSTQSKAKSAAVALLSKLHAQQATWNNGSAPGTKPPTSIISPEGRDAFSKLTGQQIDDMGNPTGDVTPTITQDDADAAASYIGTN